MSKKNQKNIISRVLTDANKNKQFVGLTYRLKKSGKWAKLNGKIYDIRVSQDNNCIVLMENQLGQIRKDGRKWATIRMDRIESVRANGMRYKK